MTELPEKRRQKLVRKLRHKYRLVVMNDETFEERYSFKLSRLNLFTFAGLTVIGLIIITTFVIAFTPMREYIPGYAGDLKTRRNLVALVSVIDSLEENARQKDMLIENIKNVIDGRVGNAGDTLSRGRKPDLNAVKLTATAEEARFRNEVEEQDQYNLSETARSDNFSEISSYHFFTPMKGKVTTTFNPAERHFGIDVVAPKNEAVKSTLDGTVVFAGWTSETGHVIQIQHSNNLLSVYKHNSVLLKKEGEKVNAGDPIAITGNSGELSTSPHLHFELWFEGKPIDPQAHMVF
jgi:murein DD-endopeptidase MepM/ murein hydrolase activator NlpD